MSHAVLAALILGGGALALSPGQAWSQGASAAQQYAVAAGPLATALTEFAAASGVMISFDPAQTQGLSSSGLTGRYTVQEGFARLLGGTGLQAVEQGAGAYVLRPGAAVVAPTATAAPAALPEITVRGSKSTGITEGTGSYTSVAPITTATKLGLTLRETPQSITVITRDRMDDQGLNQLTDVFRQTTGLVFVQNGSQGTDSNSAWARGFEIENYQIDGVPQLGSWLTQTADLAIYDRVEVLRGSSGLLTGAGTPSAAINLVRKRPTALFKGSASLTAGSWDRYRGEVDVSGPLNESGSVRGRVLVAAQKGGSWIERLKEEGKTLYAIIETDLSSTTKLTAGYEYQQHKADATARNGLPLYFSDGTETHFDRSRNSATNWAYSYQTQEQVFASVDQQLSGGWALKVNFNQARRKYDDVVGYALAGNPDRNTGAGLGVWSNKWNATPVQNALDFYASGPFKLFGRQHDLVVGYNVSRTSSKEPGYAGWPTLPTIPDIFNWDGNSPAQPVLADTGLYRKSEVQSGLYSTVRIKPTDALSVILGARKSEWRNDNNGYKRQETGVVTPYAGVVYDLDKTWSVYGSYTDIFKPQDKQDITSRYLEPLTGQAHELGAKAAFLRGQLNVSMAVFKVKQSNVGVYQGGVVPLDPAATHDVYALAPDLSSKGYEAEVTGQLLKDWQVTAGYTHVETKSKAGKPFNTNVPQDQLKLFTSYRIAQIGRGLTLGGGVTWQGAIFEADTGPAGDQRFTQPAYRVVDLMARYPITDRWSVAANWNNVFDKTYYTSTTSSYYGAPRNVNVTVKYQFD